MAAPSLSNQLLNQICSFSANALVEQPNEQTVNEFCTQAKNNWSMLIQHAEEHGLAPAMWQALKPYSEFIPEAHQKTLKVLNLRQQMNYAAQHEALLEIRQVFDEADIDMLLLKGSALRYSLYTPASQRMMFDMDILINDNNADIALQCLRDIGYYIPTNSTLSKVHHHLPAAKKTINDFDIVVELHTQAISKDMNTPISFDQHLPFREIKFADKSWLVLGHIQSLQHLCLHTFTRDEVIKLSGIVDIVRYASHYFEEIDWQLIKKQYPFIINTIALLDAVVTRNPKLTTLAPLMTQSQKESMTDVGRGMMPLREALNKNKPFRQKCRDIFLPPKWWTHIYYNVPANRSLIATRLWRHPKTAIKWIIDKELHVVKQRLKKS